MSLAVALMELEREALGLALEGCKFFVNFLSKRRVAQFWEEG